MPKAQVGDMVEFVACSRFGPSMDGAYLVAPDKTGGWALAGWDGANWYDLYSGDLLTPFICAQLPNVALLVNSLNGAA